MSTAKNEYETAKRELSGLVHASFQLSRRILGRQSGIPREHLASTFLAKTNLGALSFTKLLPTEREVSEIATGIEADQFFDVSSLASLARNLIEGSLRLFYFCIEPVSPDEFAMRLKIHEHHAVHKHLSISRRVGLNATRLKKLETELTALQAELNAMPLFAALKREVQNHIFKGRWGEASTLPDIAEKRGLNRQQFLADYKYLSSHSHSDAYSLFDVRMRSTAGGLMNDESRSFTTNLISEASAYVAIVMLDVSSLFPEFRMSPEGDQKVRSFAARFL